MVCLCHGFQGSHNDFNRLTVSIVNAFTNADLSVLIISPVSNEGFPILHPTRQGVLPCAKRARQEILQVLNTHEDASHLDSLIVLGHSFGGVYARAVIKMLVDDDVIPTRLRPLSFISVASPHLGIRWRPSVLTSIFQYGAGVVAGITGTDLLLENNKQGVSTLVTIAEGKYLDALALFGERTCYGNIRGDTQVPLCTATLRTRNPYHGKAYAAPNPTKYPSIVQLVDESGDERGDERGGGRGSSSVKREEDVRIPFESNELGARIRVIHENLSSLSWTKVDCLLGFNCHNEIIANYFLFPTGVDVGIHIAETMVRCCSLRSRVEVLPVAGVTSSTL